MYIDELEKKLIIFILELKIYFYFSKNIMKFDWLDCLVKKQRKYHNRNNRLNSTSQ